MAHEEQTVHEKTSNKEREKQLSTGSYFKASPLPSFLPSHPPLPTDARRLLQVIQINTASIQYCYTFSIRFNQRDAAFTQSFYQRNLIMHMECGHAIFGKHSKFSTLCR